MDCDICRMERVRRVAVGELWGGEVEAQLVRAWIEVCKSLEMGLSNWPIDRRKVIIETADS